MTDLFTNDDQSQIAAYIPSETSKYKSLDELAKGAYEKDRHITTLEQENRELRSTNLLLKEDNMTKAKLEEYVDQLTKSASASARPTSDGTNPKPADVSPFDPRQLEPMFDKRIKEYEASKTKEQNVKAVTDALKERYGHSFPEVLQKQTEELGLTKEAVNYLAETAPRAFFRTLGLDQAPQKESFDTPPRKSVHFSPMAQPERTWAYYDDLQKKDPNTFRSPKIQEQMLKDYTRLGPKFEDGNFLAYGQQSAF
jgi:hypothetical protein